MFSSFPCRRHRRILYLALTKKLKGLAQAKIIKKSVILFWLLNMTIWCKHVHGLELQKFLNFSAAHTPVGLDVYRDEIPVFLIFDMVVNN